MKYRCQFTPVMTCLTGLFFPGAKADATDTPCTGNDFAVLKKTFTAVKAWKPPGTLTLQSPTPVNPVFYARLRRREPEFSTAPMHGPISKATEE